MEAVLPQVLRSAVVIWRIIELASCWLNCAIIIPTITRPLHGFSGSIIFIPCRPVFFKSWHYRVVLFSGVLFTSDDGRKYGSNARRDFFCDITRRYAFQSSSRSFSSPLLHSWGRVWCAALRKTSVMFWIIFQLSTPDSVSFVVPRFVWRKREDADESARN